MSNTARNESVKNLIAALSGNALALEKLCYRLAETVADRRRLGIRERPTAESRLRYLAKLSEMEREVLGSVFPGAEPAEEPPVTEQPSERPFSEAAYDIADWTYDALTGIHKPEEAIYKADVHRRVRAAEQAARELLERHAEELALELAKSRGERLAAEQTTREQAIQDCLAVADESYSIEEARKGIRALAEKESR